MIWNGEEWPDCWTVVPESPVNDAPYVFWRPPGHVFTALFVGGKYRVRHRVENARFGDGWPSYDIHTAAEVHAWCTAVLIGDST